MTIWHTNVYIFFINPNNTNNNNHFINSKYILLLEYICVCYRNEYFKNKTVHIQCEHQKHSMEKNIVNKNNNRKKREKISNSECVVLVLQNILDLCTHTHIRICGTIYIKINININTHWIYFIRFWFVCNGIIDE